MVHISNWFVYIDSSHFVSTLRFKTIYALRVHCKKQEERKCEICLQAFCKRSALKAHQEQGCEGVLESLDQQNLEDSKPTFVDCISEPAPCVEPDVNLDASFMCEIIPKELRKIENENGIESGDDIEQDELAPDSSNHATTSADNDSVPLGRRRRRVKNRTKTKTKVRAKTKKMKTGKHRERNRLYEYDQLDECSGTIYYCYLCKRR